MIHVSYNGYQPCEVVGGLFSCRTLETSIPNRATSQGARLSRTSGIHDSTYSIVGIIPFDNRVRSNVVQL